VERSEWLKPLVQRRRRMYLKLRISGKVRRKVFKFKFIHISKNRMLPEMRHKNDQDSKNEVESCEDGQTKQPEPQH
jgi:hypothetical protein